MRRLSGVEGCRIPLAALAAALLLTACPAKPPPPPSIGTGDFHLVATDGGFTLESQDAGALLRFPLDALQLGTVPSLDDTQSYDPYWLEQRDAFFSPVVPRGLRFRAPSAVVLAQAAPDALTATLDYGDGLTATLSLREEGEGRFVAQLTPAIPSGLAVAFTRLRPRADATEAFYGLGEFFDSVNHRGKRRPMQLEADLDLESSDTENHVTVPFLVGTRGWGLFVESRRAGLFDVAHKDDELVEVTFGTAEQSGEGLRFHLFAAATPLDVTARYSAATSPPALPAPWALGPWFWRNESCDEAQVLDDVAKLRSLDLATTGLWLDRPYATHVNSFDFDPARYPDVRGLFAAAQASGLAVALWHTPYLETGAEPFLSEATHAGYFPPKTGTLLNGWGPPLDFTAAGATAWWQKNLGAYTDAGVVGFKLDFAEDVVPGLSGKRTAWRFADGSDERTMHSLYTLKYHEAYAQLFLPESSFLLCRAGHFGDQVHAPIIWPGDIDASLTRFKEPLTVGNSTVAGVGGLPSAVIAGQSLGVVGFPFFGADTGGYRHSPPDKETWVRWVEQSALSTVMQTGDSSSQAPWEYTAANGRDDAALAVYRSMARLHLRLFPFLWTYAVQNHSTGRPLQRALGLAYPELGVHPDDEYLLGDELLVAPVVTKGATTRTLTLPPGRWLDFWTGEAHDGPGSLTVAAPLETIPLFLREGALVPLLRPTIDTLLPVTQAGVDSFAADPGVLTVRVAPGTGALTLSDGTSLAQPSPRELTLSEGSVFHQGFLVEVLATPSVTQVILDDSPLSAVALSALDASEQAYSLDPAGSGTLGIRVPHGTHHVVVR